MRKQIFRCYDFWALYQSPLQRVLNYMTQPSTTQILALPARTEQYGLFLTPNDWTVVKRI